MNKELMAAIQCLEKERGIDSQMLFEAIEEALVFAYKREFDAKASDNVRAEVNRETGEMQVFLEKEVVEQVEDPNSQISLQDALALSEDFELGDVLEYQLSPQDFGRLAATTAKNVINQKLCTAEKERIQKEFQDRIGELAVGVIQRKDRREVVVDIGRAEAVLTYNEQVASESYDFNKRMRFYILKVDEKAGRPVVFVSRSHPNLVRKLFEQEVPEVKDGIVEIVNIAREPGVKCKVAVYSHDSNIEALGACVGQRGARVNAIGDELGAEKVDIVLWNEDPAIYIKQALNPAKVMKIVTDEETHEANVCVPNNQLSLAIGKEGINARLAARLTGWKVNIMRQSEYEEKYNNLSYDTENDEESINEVGAVLEELGFDKAQAQEIVDRASEGPATLEDMN